MKRAAPNPKHCARRALLHHLCEFSLARAGGFSGLENMKFTSTTAPAVGSLVAPQCHRNDKWYLAWVHQVQPRSGGFTTYTLESVEDGEVADWHNIGILEYNRAEVADHPHWRWTDRQFAFNDRWLRCCYRARGAHMHLPVWAEFGPERQVTLRVRVRHGLRDCVPEKTFPDWRKVTKAQMLAFYDDADRAIMECMAPGRRARAPVSA